MNVPVELVVAKADALGVAAESGARPWPWNRPLGCGRGVGCGLWSYVVLWRAVAVERSYGCILLPGIMLPQVRTLLSPLCKSEPNNVGALHFS